MHCATVCGMTTKEPKTAVSVYLDPADIRRLGVAAEDLQRAKADVCRLAVQQYLDQLGITDPAAEGGSGAKATAERQRRTGR